MVGTLVCVYERAIQPTAVIIVITHWASQDLSASSHGLVT